MDAAVSSMVDLFTATGASTDNLDETPSSPSSVGSVEEDEDAGYLREERAGMGQF